ncbi:hypothetical protein QYE76_044850 [Lolium multiflorum]|uniref:Uncharacterized protein n=1 Tax=Lolium multiflorum TaxID=4521 RepID=A0AAD8WWX6_LOLMU|nr:hypothetical protein QYE76_044850 [Lolium multiflorum]
MFSDTVEKYALEDHLLEDDCPAYPMPPWVRNDAIVRSWLSSAVAPELLAMVIDTTTPLHAHALWTRLSNIYRDNADTRSSYLEQEFHGLQQGSMTVADYCRKQKVLADELNELGTTITDKRLVQNTVRGLGSRLAYIYAHAYPKTTPSTAPFPAEERPVLDAEDEGCLVLAHVAAGELLLIGHRGCVERAGGAGACRRPCWRRGSARRSARTAPPRPRSTPPSPPRPRTRRTGSSCSLALAVLPRRT